MQTVKEAENKTILAMADRIAQQSELLSNRAEKHCVLSGCVICDNKLNPSRKQQPVASGVLAYFPLSMKAIAHCSYVGNEQHNPGQPVHWDRSKSTDEDDALIRHFIDSMGPDKIDTDGVRHSTKVAWRALARLEKELEAAK